MKYKGDTEWILHTFKNIVIPVFQPFWKQFVTTKHVLTSAHLNHTTKERNTIYRHTVHLSNEEESSSTDLFFQSFQKSNRALKIRKKVKCPSVAGGGSCCGSLSVHSTSVQWLAAQLHQRRRRIWPPPGQRWFQQNDEIF